MGVIITASLWLKARFLTLAPLSPLKRAISRHPQLRGAWAHVWTGVGVWCCSPWLPHVTLQCSSSMWICCFVLGDCLLFGFLASVANLLLSSPSPPFPSLALFLPAHPLPIPPHPPPSPSTGWPAMCTYCKLFLFALKHPLLVPIMCSNIVLVFGPFVLRKS